MNRRRLRPYVTPRNLGLTVLAILLLAGMTAMGVWQLGAYNERQALATAETTQARPVPLDRLLGPDQAFTAEAHARPVVVQGEYAEQQLLVDRGADDPWVVTPLVTDSGSAVLVVRGLAESDPRDVDLAAPPAGRVRVVGSLQPSQARGGDDDPTDNRVPTLSTAQLIGEFEQDLYSGFVVLTDQRPPSSLPKATPPQPDASFTVGLRNLMYAVQWWVFGAFVVFMWWRVVRDETRVP